MKNSPFPIKVLRRESVARRASAGCRFKRLTILAFSLVAAVAAIPSAGRAQYTPAALSSVKTFYAAAFADGLTIGPDGNFYGLTSTGGDYGAGSVYRLTPAGVLTTTYNFRGPEGSQAVGRLLLASDGYFYGATAKGGAANEGTIFKLSPDGATRTTIYEFGTQSGVAVAEPSSGLVQGADGKFYGLAAVGSTGFAVSGPIYSLDANGVVNLIYKPSLSGTFLRAPLAVGGDGNVYGIQIHQGAPFSSDSASLFKVTPNGGIAFFNGPDSVSIFQDTAMVSGADGNLYGTVSAGGTYHLGSLYRLSTAGTLTILHSFNGTDGYYPSAYLTPSGDGGLIGITGGGGGNGAGTIFKSTLTGDITTLYSSSGTLAFGTSQPVLGGDGALYNTSATAIYRLTTGGASDVLYTLPQNNPLHPKAPLLAGDNGKLYGTTTNDGANGLGTIYASAPDGATTVLHSFSSSEGTQPLAALAEDTNGHLYGTTTAGGANSLGTIFELANDGTLTVLHDFTAADGSTPGFGLTAGGDGNFYGTTQAGGASGVGSVFKITPAGVFTVVHEFTGADGSVPAGGLTLGAGGKLYGTTRGGGANNTGTVYSITAAGVFATVHAFDVVINGYNVEGANPTTALTLGGDGSLYGFTAVAGQKKYGTVYKVTPNGVVTAFYNFAGSDPKPATPFTEGSDGKLYAFFVINGGDSGNINVLYRATTDGRYDAISLSGNPGYGAPSVLTLASDGAFYGTVSGSGTSFSGGIFKLSLYVPAISSAQTAAASQGDAFSYQITANASPTSYSAAGLPGGLSVNTSTGVISGAPTVSGTFNVTLGATNVNGTGTGPLTLTVTPVPLQITSSLNASARQGSAFTYQITATNGPTSYGASGLPAGLQLAGNTISGTPTVYGTFAVQLSVSNSHGSGSATLNLVSQQAQPAVTSNLSAPGRQGVAFSYQITATNSPTSYGASGLPAGLNINQSTGAITGTPTVYGTFSVGLTATNSGGDGTATLSLVVSQAAPGITSDLSASSRQGATFSYQITATNSPTSYAASGLPSRLSINATTGAITGTPTVYGTFSVGLTATNGGGDGTASLSLVVTQAAPVITSSLNPPSRQGVAFAYQIAGSNNPTSYGASGLPAGLSINQSTGRISGTPATAGTSSVTITVFNSGGSGTAILTLDVQQATPQITSSLNASAQAGVAFSYQISATYSPTKYGASGLPAGLKIDQGTGKITGMPTAAAGTYSMTIAAFNSGGSGTAVVSLVIEPATPVITSELNPPSRQGVSFLYQITATNSPASYAATGLPTGLSVSASTGKITGRPTVSGTFGVVVKAINSGGTGTATVNLVVKPAA